MSWLWWLILGILIGWLVEWVIDWLYWRRRADDGATATQEQARLASELVTARGEVQRLTRELATARAAAAPTGVNQQQYESVRAALAKANAEGERLQMDLVLAQGEAQQHKSALAALERELADCRDGRVGLQAELNQLKSQQAASPLQTMVLPTTVVERELAAYASAQPPRRDPLIDINGIGPVYQQRLFDAGITTFEQLGALDPEGIRAIIKSERWQEIDAEAWIAEARTFAQRRERSEQA